MTKNLSEHIQKSAQETNLPNNQTEHIQNSAQHSNVTKNPTKHIQNSAQSTNKMQILKNTVKTVRKKLRTKHSNTTHKTYCKRT